MISEWVEGILVLVSSDLLKQEEERARLAEEMFRREQERLKEVSIRVFVFLYLYRSNCIYIALVWRAGKQRLRTEKESTMN